MRVYKFLNTRFGLKVLKEQRVKMAEINDLNDPFELIPFDLSNLQLREALRLTRDEMHRRHGLVCFSQRWSNPVLWSHYSENHRGICLGFDTGEGLAKAVDYVSARLQFPPPHVRPTQETVEQMLYTKYDAWGFEQEIRIWTTRGERENDGIYYMPIDNKNLALREVILGARSSVDWSVIGNAIEAYQPPVKTIKARLSWSSFEVVEDRALVAGA